MGQVTNFEHQMKKQPEHTHQDTVPKVEAAEREAPESGARDFQHTVERSQELLEFFRISVPKVVLSEPRGKEMTLAEAASFASKDDWLKINRSVDQLKHSQALAKAPILGIIGELNSGKSSVVSSFLAPESQGRIPRGLADASGTHRFIYWVPDSWKGTTKIELFQSWMQTQHGKQYEFLPEDTVASASAYNQGRDDRTVFEVPLIAFDSKLSEGTPMVALLDSPDFQTASRKSDGSSHRDKIRMDFIVDASELCSALLLVWSRSTLRGDAFYDILGRLRELDLPAPIFLLINKVDTDESPSDILKDLKEDFSKILGPEANPFKAEYVAFNFKYRDWAQVNPPDLVALNEGIPQAQQLPRFFRISRDASENAANAVAPERYLSALPSQLDPAAVQAERLSQMEQSTRKELLTLLRETLPQKAAKCRDEVGEQQEAIIRLCVRHCTDEAGRPLQFMKGEFQDAYHRALIDRCPRRAGRLYLKWTAVADKSAVRVRRTISKGAIKAGRKIRDVVQPERAVMRAHNAMKRSAGVKVLSPEGMAKDFVLDKGMRWPDQTDTSKVEEAIREGNDWFSHVRVKPDKAEISKLADAYWNSQKNWKVARMILKQSLKVFGSFAIVVGGVFAWADGGTTVAVGSIVSAAGVLGLGAGWVQSLTRCNTIPYLSALILCLCDAFGVVRPDLSTRKVSFKREDGEKRGAYFLQNMPLPPKEAVLPVSVGHAWRAEANLKILSEQLGGTR